MGGTGGARVILDGLLHLYLAARLYKHLPRARKRKLILESVKTCTLRKAAVAQMRDAVRSVARLFPTAIISGRGREKVAGFVKLQELFYAGSHGMDIIGPSVR